MSSTPQDDAALREQLKLAVRDGLSNHTKEFINPWIMSKNYSHEELQTMLEDIMNSNRLFSNLSKLITAQKEAWQDRAVQVVLNDVNDTLFFSTTQPSGQFIKDTIMAKLDEIEARNIAKQLKKGGE